MSLVSILSSPSGLGASVNCWSGQHGSVIIECQFFPPLFHTIIFGKLFRLKQNGERVVSEMVDPTLIERIRIVVEYAKDWSDSG